MQMCVSDIGRVLFQLIGPHAYSVYIYLYHLHVFAQGAYDHLHLHRVHGRVSSMALLTRII